MKHIPNILSAARLAAAPYLFLLLWERDYKTALMVALVCGLTDGFDGFLARRFHAASRLGAYLDPVADKVLLSGAFLTLGLDGAVDKWLVILVLGRDAGILLFAAGAFAFSKSFRDFPPSIWGKASTVAQIAFVLAVLLHFIGYASLPVVTALKWLVAILAVWSGLDYLIRGAEMLRLTIPFRGQK